MIISNTTNQASWMERLDVGALGQMCSGLLLTSYVNLGELNTLSCSPCLV